MSDRVGWAHTRASMLHELCWSPVLAFSYSGIWDNLAQPLLLYSVVSVCLFISLNLCCVLLCCVMLCRALASSSALGPLEPYRQHRATSADPRPFIQLLPGLDNVVLLQCWSPVAEAGGWGAD